MDERPRRPDAADEWRRHAGFLRRLAHGLVGDLGLTDDVLQEAWLAAQGSSASPRSGRAWLSGVVKNLARGLRRQEARRHRREERGARPEALPSVAETAERMELLQRVVACVGTLDEPYRTVLLLRFLDERTPEEIARRQGVPVETVRTQVRRGLERLRGRFAADGLTERQWLGALLPGLSLGKVAAVGAATATSTTILSGVLMSTKAKLAITLGVVAIASIASWRLVGRETERAEASASRQPATLTAATTTPAEPVAPVSEPATPPASDERVALAGRGGWRVHGRIVGGEELRAGLALTAKLWEGATLDEIDREAPPTRELSLFADEDGAFERAVPDVSGACAIVVEPAGETLAGTIWQAVPGRADVAAGAVPGALELTLAPVGCVIFGVVRNDEGEPLSDAQVRLYDDPVPTGDDGSYRIAVAAGSRPYVYARAPGYAEVRSSLSETAHGQEYRVDFELKPEFRVQGVVRDLQGRPIEGARVTSFYSHENDAVTDALGRYRLGHLDPGRPTHSVNARAEGYVLSSVEVTTVAGGVATQDFELDHGVHVTGRVVDAEGAPLAGASLYIGFSPHAFNRLDAETDADGTFTFPSVQRGSETLVVQKQGFQPHRRVIELPADRDRLEGLEVVMQRGRFLAGRVVDEGGTPLAGVGISVRYRGEHIDVRGRSDEEGRFRLEDLPESDVRLSFYTSGRRLQRLHHDVERLDVDDLEVVMLAGGGLAGRVVDDATGAPLERFRIRFVDPTLAEGEQRLWGYSATWSREGKRFEGTGGTWDTGDDSNWMPGSVVGIEASAEGYAPAVATRVVVTTELDPDASVLRLRSGAAVTGSVVLAATGEAVADAIVKLYRAEESITHDSDDTHGRPLVHTDATGHFRIGNVSPGSYRVLVSKDGCPDRLVDAFEVLAGVGAELRVELQPGAGLAGTVLDDAGRPRPGVHVRLEGLRGAARVRPFGWLARTDEHGAYAFEDLPDGLYRVGPEVDDGSIHLAEYRIPLQLAVGEQRRLDLAPEGSAVLTGRLDADVDLPELLPVQVSAVDTSTADLVAQGVRYGGMAEHGVFELRGLEPGTYRVGVHWRDWTVNTLWFTRDDVVVELRAGETTDARLELESSSY